MGRNNQTTGRNRVVKRGFERPEKLGQNKEAGNKMAWGRRGRGHIYTNEHVNRGYERGFTPVTPC